MEHQTSIVYSGQTTSLGCGDRENPSINTNQGDSEVLLVENVVVYYRAAEQLYSASIRPDGIGAPHLLAADNAFERLTALR
jgi:hypothetical protein